MNTISLVTSTPSLPLNTTDIDIIVQDPYRYGLLSGHQVEVLSIIFLVTSLLSLLGSGSIIFITIKKKIVCQTTILSLFHLCLADFLGGVVLLIGVLYHVIEKRLHWSDRTPCLVITMLATSFYMTTFLLTITYAWQVYHQVTKQTSVMYPSGGRARISMESTARCYQISTTAFLTFLSWMVPFMISMTVMFSDSDYDDDGTFYLNDDMCSCCFPLFVYESADCQRFRKVKDHKFNWYTYYKWIFVVLLFISCVAVIVLYLLTYLKFKRVIITQGIIGRSQYEMIKRIRRKGGLLAGVFVLSWISTLLLGFTSFHQHFKMNKYYVLFVLQACTSPLQGFLNSIVYGWQRKSFRTAINEERNKSQLLDPLSETSEERFQDYYE